MLLCLLLQLAQASDATRHLQITPALVLSVLALLCTIALAMRRESREDGQTTSQRLKKQEVVSANHEQRFTGQEQAQEKLAEHMRTELAAHMREMDRRCQNLEEAVKEMPRLKENIAEMKADLKRLEKIENKLDRLTEIISQKI